MKTLKTWAAVLILAVISGCVTAPPLAPPDEEAVRVRLPYVTAFDRLLSRLRAEGYEIAIAEKSIGIIETVPRRIPGDQGRLQHKSMLSFLLQGNRSFTDIYLRVIVTSDDPAERDRTLELLRGL